VQNADCPSQSKIELCTASVQHMPHFPTSIAKATQKQEQNKTMRNFFNPFSMKKVVAVFPENSKQNKTMRNSSTPPFRCQNAEPGDWNIKQRTARPHRPPRFELFQYCFLYHEQYFLQSTSLEDYFRSP
jgi:hypothetical protein